MCLVVWLFGCLVVWVVCCLWLLFLNFQTDKNNRGRAVSTRISRMWTSIIKLRQEHFRRCNFWPQPQKMHPQKHQERKKFFHLPQKCIHKTPREKNFVNFIFFFVYLFRRCKISIQSQGLESIGLASNHKKVNLNII